MINRRGFLKLAASAAAGLFIPVKMDGFLKTYLFVPARSLQTVLDPTLIPKYSTQLIIPPAMPRVSEITLPDGSAADYYEITVKQFEPWWLPPARWSTWAGTSR